MEGVETDFKINKSLIHFEHVFELLSKVFMKLVVCNIQTEKSLVGVESLNEELLEFEGVLVSQCQLVGFEIQITKCRVTLERKTELSGGLWPKAVTFKLHLSENFVVV